MRPTPVVKLFVVFLVALLANAPAYASCTPGGCSISPCVCYVDNVDPTFEENCSNWSWSGDVYRSNSGSDYYAEVAGWGNVQQEFTVTSGTTDMELIVDVDVVTGSNPGTERVIFDILSSSGTLLETLGTVFASNSSDTYRFLTSGYAGSTIRLRIRYGTGISPGDTIFRVDNAYFWSC